MTERRRARRASTADAGLGGVTARSCTLTTPLGAFHTGVGDLGAADPKFLQSFQSRHSAAASCRSKSESDVKKRVVHRNLFTGNVLECLLNTCPVADFKLASKWNM